MADPLAILGAVETCLNLSKMILDIAVAVRDMQKEHVDLNLNLEYDTLMLKKFIAYFREFEKMIDEETRMHLVKLTGSLNRKLAGLGYEMKKRKKANPLNRLTWYFVRDGLATAEADLEHWLTKFNRILTWLPEDLARPLLESFASDDYKERDNPLSPLVAADAMRRALKSSISEEDMDSRLSSLADDSLPDRATDTFFEPDVAKVPDYFQGDKDYSRQIHREVVKLVAVLSHAETDKMHILKAYKYFTNYRGDGDKKVVLSYGIAYQKPRRMKVNTLKALVASGQSQQFSLNERIRVAVEIASAVAYIHAIGWVHEMVRSEHVLLCNDLDGSEERKTPMGTVKICGFDASREVAGRNVSRNEGDGNWIHELYCHPDRQQKSMNRPHPADVTRFEAKHDVYSLGVVLLEMGLWQDLESFKKAADPSKPLLQIAEPNERQISLRELANQLPAKAGDTYKRLVVEAINIDEHDLTATQMWSELDNLRL